MKALKTLLAGSVALALVGTAAADTTIHITGSTAFRKATVVAVENLMGGAGNFKAYFVGTSGDEKGANLAIIQGTMSSLPSAGIVTVKCSWSGSVGGIQTVVQNLNVAAVSSPASGWIANSMLPGTNVVTNAAFGSTTFDAAAPAEITMSDSLPASTGFSATGLTSTKVGVIVFEWVANNGSPAGITNITPLLARQLLAGGTLVSQFTGIPANTDFIYAVGRNFDSGTRLSELAEVGLGVGASVQQLIVTTTGTNTSSTSATVTGLDLYPAESVLSIPFTIGQSGYGSGGTVAAIMATPGSNTASASGNIYGPGWLVSYLGRNDANTACSSTVPTGNTARRLTWNGVADWGGSANGTKSGTAGGSTQYNDDAVTNGQYTAWEYEWLVVRSSLANASGSDRQLDLANAIATQAQTDAGQSGVKLTDMHVARDIEGGVIYPQ